MWWYHEKISGGTCVINAESVKARLKNLAVKDGGTDIDRLNVKEFKLNDGKISDSNSEVTSDAVALIQSAVGSGSSINLANKKNITIIKML